jgi:hypothetical protein
MHIKTNLRFFKDFTRTASGLLASRWSQGSTGKVEMKTHYQQVPLEIVKNIVEAKNMPEKKRALPARRKKEALKQGSGGIRAIYAGDTIS